MEHYFLFRIYRSGRENGAFVKIKENQGSRETVQRYHEEVGIIIKGLRIA